MMSPTLDPFRAAMERHRPPIVVFNKSHSGSRLLGTLLKEAGIAMGAHVNESLDSLDMLELVEYVVTRYYPDYSALWRADLPPDRELQQLLERVFTRHMNGVATGAPWGWKLCETVYVLPVLAYCFPQGQFVHLIRDGRDVAFCDHKGPDNPFWRKVYFNTDRIRTHGALRLSAQAYRRRPYLYNTLHWMNSVRIGRDYGAMLGARYHEVRYEQLCADFPCTAAALLSALDAPQPEAAIARVQAQVSTGSVGKFRRHPSRRQRAVLALAKPLLLELGYLEHDPDDGTVRLAVAAAVDRVVDRWFRG
jgi:hypothetical protein